jgi:uncharacterized protein with HEPN domain
VSGGKDEFYSNKMIQDAVIRNLEIIGEAVKNISPVTRSHAPEVPWKKIAGLRDVLIHEQPAVKQVFRLNTRPN